jgi:hypothetical protein
MKQISLAICCIGFLASGVIMSIFTHREEPAFGMLIAATLIAGFIAFDKEP